MRVGGRVALWWPFRDLIVLFCASRGAASRKSLICREWFSPVIGEQNRTRTLSELIMRIILILAFSNICTGEHPHPKREQKGNTIRLEQTGNVTLQDCNVLDLAIPRSACHTPGVIRKQQKWSVNTMTITKTVKTAKNGVYIPALTAHDVIHIKVSKREALYWLDRTSAKIICNDQDGLYLDIDYD